MRSRAHLEMADLVGVNLGEILYNFSAKRKKYVKRRYCCVILRAATFAVHVERCYLFEIVR